jgi:hypothetical protein
MEADDPDCLARASGEILLFPPLSPPTLRESKKSENEVQYACLAL